MKINLKQVFVFLLLILFVVLMCLPFAGCSSVNKQKQKSSIEKSASAEIDSSETKTVKATETKKEDAKSESSSETSESEVHVAPGESLKIENFGPDGKSLGSKVYSGSGYIKNKKTNETKSESKTIDTKSDSEEVSKIALKKKSNTKENASQSSADKQKKGFSFLDYLSWLWLIIIVLVFIYLNKRFKIIQGISNVIHSRNED